MLSCRKKIPEHDRKKIFNKKPLFACVLAIQSRRLLLQNFEFQSNLNFQPKIFELIWREIQIWLKIRNCAIESHQLWTTKTLAKSTFFWKFFYLSCSWFFYLQIPSGVTTWPPSVNQLKSIDLINFNWLINCNRCQSI